MQPKTRLAMNTALAAINAAIFAATALWPDWIELVFDAVPDEGKGEFEWTIMAVSGLLSVALILVVRVDWRRQHPAAGAINHD
jgi:hypothetical protein